MFRKTIIINEYQAGLHYVNGRFRRKVGPGQYGMLQLPWKKETVIVVDMRQRSIHVTGQEMLTTDHISVRLNVVVTFSVIQPETAIHSVESFENSLYTAVQLALRDRVTQMSMDELLADRSHVAASVFEDVKPMAQTLGLQAYMVGIKDIVLPGEIRKVLAQETENLRAGKAALAAAREETAAMRARANTAALFQNNPALLRIRELESMVEMGKSYGNTIVLALPSEALTPETVQAGLSASK